MTYLITNLYNKQEYRRKLAINTFKGGHMFLIFKNK